MTASEECGLARSAYAIGSVILAIALFAIPGGKLFKARHFERIGVRVDRHLNDSGFTAGKRALDRGTNVFRALDIFTVSTKPFGDFVEPQLLAPMRFGFGTLIAIDGMIDLDLRCPDARNCRTTRYRMSDTG